MTYNRLPRNLTGWWSGSFFSVFRPLIGVIHFIRFRMRTPPGKLARIFLSYAYMSRSHITKFLFLIPMWNSTTTQRCSLPSRGLRFSTWNAINSFCFWRGGGWRAPYQIVVAWTPLVAIPTFTPHDALIKFWCSPLNDILMWIKLIPIFFSHWLQQ